MGFNEWNYTANKKPPTFTSTGQSESRQGTHYAKHFDAANCVNFAGIWIRSQQLDTLSTRYENLLCLLSRKVTVDGMVNTGSSLQSQVVQMHFHDVNKTNGQRFRIKVRAIILALSALRMKTKLFAGSKCTMKTSSA